MKHLLFALGIIMVFTVSCSEQDADETPTELSGLETIGELSIGYVDGAPTMGGRHLTGCLDVKLIGSVFCCPDNVKWSNASTGGTGTGEVSRDCREVWNWVFGLPGQICISTWSASVKLVPGSNVITVSATYGFTRGAATLDVVQDPQMGCRLDQRPQGPEGAQ